MNDSIATQPTNWPALAKRGLKPLVFTLSCLPVLWLGWLALNNGLGANPIEKLIRYNGDWALRFLLIALAVTPIRIVTSWADVMRVRRMLGLFAFFYVVLHISAYVGLDRFFDWHAIWADILKRIYITVGMGAFLTLVPLAITSTSGMIKRMGARAWRRMHRVVYVSTIAGIVHYIMMLKAGYQEPALYAAILAVLLGIRAIKKWP